MRRIGHLYEKVYQTENLYLALYNASKGKRDRWYVQHILKNSTRYIQELQELLQQGTYTLSPNRHKTIKDGASQKERDITIPQFYPDQIIHWALIQVLQPYFMSWIYKYNCGSVPGRGGLGAKRYVDKVHKMYNPKYTLKLDIKKFFPSVNHEKLISLFHRRFKDSRLLTLIEKIIINGGDGLPIGYYTSQWFSNFYLCEVDRYIKETLKVKYYVRYVDDIVMWGDNKRKLRRAFEALQLFLNSEYKLSIKGNWQLWKTFSRPLDFVGYRFYQNYTHLRKKIFYRLIRAVRHINSHGLIISRARHINSLIGWVKRINFKNYYLNNIFPIISKHSIVTYISNYDKSINNKLQTI